MSETIRSNTPESDMNDTPPIGWREASLAEVAEIRISNVDKKSAVGEIPIRLCNYIDVYKNIYITAALDFMEATATSSEIARFCVERGDVMITKDSETPDDIGVPAVAICSAPTLVCGYHLALFKPHKDQIDPIFLAKYLRLPRIAAYYGRLACGSTRYGLSNSGIARTPLRLPPLPQQRKIARILTTVDDLIEKTEALISKYQAIKHGMMHDLFTRGVDEHGQLRPNYEEAPELYKQSELGWIPMEWEERTIGTVCLWMSGGTPSKSNPSFWNGPISWVSPKDMKRFEIGDSEDHISEEAARIGTRMVPVGTVLIVIRGMILAHSFPVCITTAPVTFNQDIKALVFDGGVSGRFLAYWLVANAPKMIALATESTHGTKRFDMDDLQGVCCALPMSEEQTLIVARLDVLAGNQSVERLQLEKLHKIKSGLMQDLLTGTVRVKVAVEETANV